MPVPTFLNDFHEFSWKEYATGFALVVAAYAGVQGVRNFIHRRKLLQAIKDLQERRSHQFTTLKTSLTQGVSSPSGWDSKRTEIVSTSLKFLIDGLQKESYSPSEVLEAYQLKALEAQEATNCICFFITEARDWAKDLQQKYTGVADKPALYGVPVSVKETIWVKGYKPTRGYAQSLINSTDITEDACIIQALKNLGAIPFCTTNVPQSLTSLTTSNPIYGVTLNPTNFSRNSGGSSGGEGALIGFGGSPLGLGTDAAGSIRMPSHVCGIAGLKPTAGRLTSVGQAAAFPGRPWLYTSLGPMAKDTESLVIFMKAVLNEGLMFKIDPFVAPIPFRDSMLEGQHPMKVGYYTDDGLIPSIPACRRAVIVAKDALEKAGHVVTEISAPDIKIHLQDLIAVMYPDGGDYFHSLMNKDILDKYHRPHYLMYSLPFAVRRLLGFALRPIDPLLATIFGAFTDKTSELRARYANAAAFRQQVVCEWKASSLDAVICPVSAGVAYPHNFHAKCRIVASYTALYNLLNFPGGSINVTTVTDTDDSELAENYPENRFFTRRLKRANSKSHGLPVGVQCISYPHQEETVLRLMLDIEKYRLEK